MAMGTVLVNWLDDIEDLTRVAQGVTPPLFVIFFVISGAGLDFKALSGIGVVGIIYIVVRVLGKHFGAWFGATITRSEQKIRTYLGLTLMPQAGVALGLVIVAAKAVPEYAAQINVVILSSTFIYSLIGPSAAKFALIKAGEIKLPGKAAPHPEIYHLPFNSGNGYKTTSIAWPFCMASRPVAKSFRAI
jgi:hypothetical protein